MSTPNLYVEIFGKEILPIFNCSGTYNPLCEQNVISIENFGAYVHKTVTLKPQAGNKPPRITEVKYNGVGIGLINSIGLENEGFDDLLQNKLSKFKELDISVIVSIAGSFGELFTILCKIKNSKEFLKTVFAIELNVSCPNVDRKLLEDQNWLVEFVKRCKTNIPMPLIIKLPAVENIAEIAKIAESAGIDAISAVNTFRAMDIDIQTRCPKLGNIFGGYSGPAILPMALYNVWQVASSVKIPVIGMGGITCWQDAIKMFLAGASIVSIGTANFSNPNSAKLIKEGIENYLIENKISDINEIIGKLKIKNQ